MSIRRNYRRRPIRFLEIARYQGWRLKVYGIRYQGESAQEFPDPPLLEAAKRLAFEQLELPAKTQDRYGVGFLIVHQGQDRNWVLLDWWYDSEILKQRLFSSPQENALDIQPVAQADLLACTWELAIHAFERQAWVDLVLNNPSGPDLDAYCDCQLNGDQ